jgi:putative nucleotidyltransferase with HDIG domain
MPRGLTARVIVAASILLGSTALVFLLLSLAVRDLQRESDERMHALNAVTIADRTLKSVLDLETGARAYMVARRERFLEPWHAGRAELPRDIRALRALHRGTADPAAVVTKQFAAAADEYLRQHALPVVARLRGGRFAHADLVADLSDGKRRVDALRTQFATLRSLELNEARWRDIEASNAGDRAIVTSLVGLGLVVLVGVAGTAYLARTVTRPIRLVADAANEFTAGRQAGVAARMRDMRPAREVVALTEAFDEMADTVQVQHERLQAQNVSLERRVRDRTEELEEAQAEALLLLATAAEFRDDDTHRHTQRVGRNAGLIARSLGLSDETVDLLIAAAPLHDVGKIGISDTIILKPGRLTADEFEVMKQHTTIGARILGSSSTPLFHVAAEIAATHHERWDGTGYPAGLAGEDIPLAGRVVALVDVFDALTHERPYKQAWPLEQAVAEIRRSAGSHFDAAVVAAFERLDPARLLDP